MSPGPIFSSFRVTLSRGRERGINVFYTLKLGWEFEVRGPAEEHEQEQRSAIGMLSTADEVQRRNVVRTFRRF